MPDRAGMDAELMREALGAAAHDLGGVAGALSLRLDALGPSPTTEDRRALAAIADEVRTLGRQLRQLRGPPGSELLAPGRSASLRTWWPLIERFGRAVLGSGVALQGTVDESELTPERFHALTYAVLGLCREVQESDVASPALLAVHGERVGDTVSVKLRLTAPDGTPVGLAASRTPWGAYARDTARAAGCTLVVSPEHVAIEFTTA